MALAWYTALHALLELKSSCPCCLVANVSACATDVLYLRAAAWALVLINQTGRFSCKLKTPQPSARRIDQTPRVYVPLRFFIAFVQPDLRIFVFSLCLWFLPCNICTFTDFCSERFVHVPDVARPTFCSQLAASQTDFGGLRPQGFGPFQKRPCRLCAATYFSATHLDL